MHSHGKSVDTEETTTAIKSLSKVQTSLVNKIFSNLLSSVANQNNQILWLHVSNLALKIRDDILLYEQKSTKL